MSHFIADFQGDAIPYKNEAQYMWTLKIIMEKYTIEPDRYHAGHSYFYPSWLDDNIAWIFEPRVGLGNMVIDEFSEVEVQYNKLCKRVRESEVEHMAQHKADMEMINKWKERAVKSSERLEYLEYKLMELEGRIRKRSPTARTLREMKEGIWQGHSYC